MPGSYILQARRLPLATVALPPIFLAGAGIITTTRLGIASGLVLTVIAAIAGQLGRDRGRALQPALWASWGGSPTLRRLRYRDGGSAGKVERLHGRIETVLPGEVLPTAAEEAADPDGADERYEEAVARIRALTRDQERFALLFSENVSYGMRRNLLGLRRVGIAIAALTVIVAGVLLLLADGTMAQRVARYAPGVGVSLAALVFWIAVVTPNWVRLTADAYAEQFVGAVDILHTAPPAGQGT